MRNTNPLEKLHARIEDIKLMRQSGYEMTKIAEAVGVSPRTLWRYAKDDSLVSQALKTGTQELVLKLEDALYASAMGTAVVKKKKTTWIPDNTGKLIIERVEEWEEKVPINTGSLVFALKNLSNGKFIDKREYTDTSDFGNNIGMLKSILKEEAIGNDEDKQDKEHVQPTV